MTQRNNEMKCRYRHNERDRPYFFLSQVLQADSVEDFQRINWVSAKCCGYLMLLEEPRPLLALAASRPNVWDYSGRCVGDAFLNILGPTHTQLIRLSCRLLWKFPGV